MSLLLISLSQPLKWSGKRTLLSGKCKVKLLTIFLVLVNVIEALGVSTETLIMNGSDPKVPVGGVIHLFPRYGYLSLSMRVVPRNDSLSWIFLEPTKYIFESSTIHVEEKKFNAPHESLPLHNEFHIDLCEDMSQLIQAYFRRFVIDGLEYPWKAFAGGWRAPSLSKYFGIDPIYTAGDYRYMLVRVLMVQNSGKIIPFPNATVSHQFQPHLRMFKSRDPISSYNFFNEIGTHYVSSYLTGNAIYQVFVYDNTGFIAVKRRLSETGGIITPEFMAQLPILLSLWVRHMGKVFVLNSSPQAMENVRQVLVVPSLFRTTPLIFKMHNNPALVKQIEDFLKNEPGGLLGIEMKTLEILFHDYYQKLWFAESLKHTMELWEINLQ